LKRKKHQQDRMWLLHSKNRAGCCRIDYFTVPVIFVYENIILSEKGRWKSFDWPCLSRNGRQFFGVSCQTEWRRSLQSLFARSRYSDVNGRLDNIDFGSRSVVCRRTKSMDT